MKLGKVITYDEIMVQIIKKQMKIFNKNNKLSTQFMKKGTAIRKVVYEKIIR